MRQPAPHETKPAKVVRMRRWQGDQVQIEVTLHPHRTFTDTWEVYVWESPTNPLVLKWVGTIGRYTGSIDTTIKGTRLRRPGKQRVLWHTRSTHEQDRSVYERVSRAEAIRWLL